MALQGVLRPGHVSIRLLDLDEGLVHYCDRLGLEEVDRDDQGRVYLKGWDEQDYFSIVLREADAPGMDFMAFKVDSPDTLADFKQKLIDHGLAVETIPAGELKHCGERIRFTAPTGHQFELFAEKDVKGTEMGRRNPHPFPENLKGMKAQRFDHCLLYGDDLDGAVDIFVNVLGFNETEVVMDGDFKVASFMSCGMKAHDIALVRNEEKGRLHHVSFLLGSWEEVLHAADLIGRYRISIDIGPTRHGITRGRTIYFFDPSGNRNEVFSGDYSWYPDHEKITWDAAEIGGAIFYHDQKLNERFMTVTT